MSLDDELRRHDEIIRQFYETHAPIIQQFYQSYAPAIQQFQQIYGPVSREYNSHASAIRQISESYGPIIQELRRNFNQLNALFELDSEHDTDYSFTLEDFIYMLQVLAQLRDSEAIVDIRNYLDSMSPDDRSTALQSLQDFVESILDEEESDEEES